MLRKWGTLVFLLVAVPTMAVAQNTGKLAGQVIDQETGDALPGASVVLAGTQIGTISDIDGNYFIIGVPVGTYDVQASFVGYQTQTVSRVEINAGYTREINFSLSPGLELDEIVVEYERPLIQKDAIGAPKVVSGEDIANLPVRGAGRVASLQGGVVSNDSDGRLFVRGGRDEQTIFFVDGVKVVGDLGVPQSAIQEQEMLLGNIPAKYGDAMSGVISITTKSGAGAPRFFGSLEGITSEGLDPYGYNLVSGTLGGPIVANKLSFFVSGEALFQSDASPWAVQTPRLSDQQLNALLEAPQVLQFEDTDTGDLVYLPVPGTSLGPGAVTTDSLLGMMNVPENLALHSHILFDAPEVITGADLTFDDEKDNPRTRFDINGNLTYTPSASISIRGGGSYTQSDVESYGFRTSLYNRNRFVDSEGNTLRLYGTWTHRLSGNTFYQLQADFTDNKFWNFANGFSRDVAETIFYSDIDNAINSTLRAYRIYDSDSDSYVARFGDGEATSTPDPANVWEGLGRGFTGFSKGKTQQFRVSGSATTQLGVHQIEFGGEFEKQTNRFYSIGANDLSRFICDDPADANCGQETSTADELKGALTLNESGSNYASVYANVPFDFYRFRSTWYGYDMRGLNEVDNQNVDCYLSDASGNGCPGGAANHNIAPWEPIYYAGYVQNKIEFRDLVINLGLRVDVFDSNTLVLRDQFAPVPIIRAGDLDDAVPSGIGSDFGVYFDDAGNVVGFRSIDGDFFDAAGQDSDLNTINSLGQQRRKPGSPSLSSESFKDYEPEVTVMPRIGVSFPVTNQALFFASYNITSQRPREQAFNPFNFYDNLSGQSRINNPDLKPEKTIQYELGFRQSVGARAAFQVSAFLRQQKNLIQIRNVNAVGLGIGSYGNVQNIDFATTKGLEFEFDLRRTNGVALRANYTFSVAEASGSDSQTMRIIQWRGSLGAGQYFPNFIAPAAFDRRHSANLSFDYRLGAGEGPRIGDTPFLQNFGVNVSAQIGSGMPYTALLAPKENWSPFTENVDGSLNGHRMPWYNIVDVRVDRRFEVSDRAAVTAFVWVENLLDSDNSLAVYRATGLASSDGFIASPGGLAFALQRAQALGDDLAEESFLDHYGAAIDSPVGRGTAHESGGPKYSLPRRVRLGVRLSF